MRMFDDNRKGLGQGAEGRGWGDGVTDIYPKIETTYQKRRPKTPRRVAAPEFLDVLKIDALLNPV